MYPQTYPSWEPLVNTIVYQITDDTKINSRGRTVAISDPNHGRPQGRARGGTCPDAGNVLSSLTLNFNIQLQTKPI